jgi:putative inorganic carbon (HCO3(-)) transporter
MTFNSFFAFDPAYSWPHWNEVWKIYLMGLVAAAMSTSKVRYHALMWIVVLSLSYWGVKGGLFTLATGGHHHVFGPEHSIINDNNQLALAVVMILPVLNYLRLHTQSRLVRIGIVAVTILNVVTVLGSYSRGGVIALSVLAVAFWLRAKNKLIYPIAAVIIIVPLLKFMPDSFYERMDTIGQYNTDGSFQDRVAAWHVAFNYAVDHFPFGAGFYGPQIQRLWSTYYPDTAAHAAHSIYFQVLGEHGFIALFLYLLIIIVTFLNFRSAIGMSRDVPHLRWANDLARMLQLSLFAFCIGGAALSLAYYDVFVLWIWISAALKDHVKAARTAPVMEASSERPLAASEPAIAS